MKTKKVKKPEYYYCTDCKPNWEFIGEFNERYYLVHDLSTDKYLICDITGHADSIYEFSKKPTIDPIGEHEEPGDDDPRWDSCFAWIENWKEDRDNFKFVPNTAYDLLVAWKNAGWTHVVDGDIFYHILNNAGLLIEKHEQRIVKLRKKIIAK